MYLMKYERAKTTLRPGLFFGRFFLSTRQPFPSFGRFTALLLFLIVLTFAACGGGGGGSNSINNSSGGSGGNTGGLGNTGGSGGSGGGTTPQVICNTPVSLPNEVPVCFVTAEEDNQLYINTPYITVYINGKPFNLLLDTGATGILVNQSALTASGITLTRTGGTFNGSFGDTSTFKGYVASAQVQTLAVNGLTADNVPIAVDTDTSKNSSFPPTGFLQGDFGMGLSPYYSFGQSNDSSQPGAGITYTPSLVPYLAGYTNGFVMQFTPNLNQDGYSSSGSGMIVYGLNTSEQNNNVSSGYDFFPNDSAQQQAYPFIDAEFGGVIDDPNYDPNNYYYLSQNYLSLFDTGSTFIYMDDDAMENATGIANIASYEYDQNTTFGTGTAIVNGGLDMSMGLYNQSGNYDQRASFITSPDDKNLSAPYEFPDTIWNIQSGYLLFGNTILDLGNMYGQEDMGLPYFFNNTSMYWQASPWGVGIKIQ